MNINVAAVLEIVTLTLWSTFKIQIFAETDKYFITNYDLQSHQYKILNIWTLVDHLATPVPTLIHNYPKYQHNWPAVSK